VADGIRGQKTERGLARSSFKIGRQNSPSRLKNEGIKEMIIGFEALGEFIRQPAARTVAPEHGASTDNGLHFDRDPCAPHSRKCSENSFMNNSNLAMFALRSFV
jgi:hypothetical protein